MKCRKESTSMTLSSKLAAFTANTCTEVIQELVSVGKILECQGELINGMAKYVYAMAAKIGGSISGHFLRKPLHVGSLFPIERRNHLVYNDCSRSH